MLRLTAGAVAGEAGTPAASAAAASAAAPPPQSLVLQFLVETERNRFSDALVDLRKGGDGGLAGGAGAASLDKVVAARAALLNMKQAPGPELKSLYDRLVGGGVVSEEDFWASNAALVEAGLAEYSLGQRAGLPNSMLSHVRGTQDGRSSTLNYKPTLKQLAEILMEDPAVLAAYNRTVAVGAMSEKEFWTRYFRAQYFRAARRKKGEAAQTEQELADIQLFAPDPAAAAAAAAGRAAGVPAAVNLAALDDDRMVSRGGRMLGFGAEEPLLPSAAAAASAADADAARTNMKREAVLKREMILKRELNLHGMRVMDGVTAAPEGAAIRLADVARAAAARNAAAAGKSLPPGAAAREEAAEAAAEEVADVCQPPPPPLQQLQIADARRYADAAAATGGRGGEAAAAVHVQRWAAAASALRSAAPATPPLAPALAAAALTDVVGQAGMGTASGGGAPGGAATSAVPPVAVMDCFASEARATTELLRHYWASLPQPGAPPREAAARAAKRLRVRGALAAVHDKLQAVAEGLPPAQRHAAGRQLRPLLAALDASFEQDTRLGDKAVNVQPP
jgi:transcription initiation factor TFIIH subunit 1